MDTILLVQRKQRLVWGAATLLIALLGLAQRDQRGLLSGPETPTTASAFAAITPQSPSMSITGTGGGQGLRRLFGRSGGAGSPQFTAATDDTPPATGFGPSVFDRTNPDAQNAPSSALLALADPGSGGINAGPGSSGGIPTISPGGPQQTVSASDPGAVPEAPMWAIMILGVGGIGYMARRERSRGRLAFKAQRI